ncbi:glutamine synthetase inactivating factor IF7 [Stanieria cyanosphaera PCC 7437]|uniref:Glutamine synthetase inactivating factor IF7 n=1 Tax=Stanieria cyanosphaera (strain ATCC 29371 / PCC 7437) TaxID=111780 RepID=K9XWE1_STAC7|nr:hypothetical protein [Stanieria cyanosphaera]AFZ36401.1 glutamine synthetase inactivating factor IF7 [Stanieria cyanosphaera PCC 7437]
MSIQTKARALLNRHHQMIRNREQSMLLRTATEIGFDVDTSHYYSHIQGKTPAQFNQAYHRSRSTMS